MGDMDEKPEHVEDSRAVDEELQASRSSSTTNGRLKAELAELSPKGIAA